MKNISWFLKFIHASNTQQANSAAPILLQLNNASKMLYSEMISTHKPDSEMQENGLLIAATTAKGFKEEIELSILATKLDIPTEIISPDAVSALEPNLNLNIAGGVWYKSDAQLHPEKHLNWLKQWLRQHGVIFNYQSEVTRLDILNGKISTVKTEKAQFKADEIVVACGTGSAALARTVNLSMPLIAGKGYSIDFPKNTLKLRRPLILTEARVAITPFNDVVRLGSGMEFNGQLGQIRNNRVKAMLKRTEEAIPSFSSPPFHELTIWEGLRPLSPDGIPYIGRTQKLKNLLFATGHAMMGMSLAPVSGQIICDLISESVPAFDLSILHPDRYDRSPPQANQPLSGMQPAT
jgi:D-amino-acid dehydrogenase